MDQTNNEVNNIPDMTISYQMTKHLFEFFYCIS